MNSPLEAVENPSYSQLAPAGTVDLEVAAALSKLTVYSWLVEVTGTLRRQLMWRLLLNSPSAPYIIERWRLLELSQRCSSNHLSLLVLKAELSTSCLFPLLIFQGPSIQFWFHDPQSSLSLAGRFLVMWSTTLNRKEGRNKYIKQHIPNYTLEVEHALNTKNIPLT